MGSDGACVKLPQAGMFRFQCIQRILDFISIGFCTEERSSVLTLVCLGKRQKWAILLDSFVLVLDQHCQVSLTHPLSFIPPEPG
jgi:hypothetical protein